jgi:hypothetical protein
LPRLLHQYDVGFGPSGKQQRTTTITAFHGPGESGEYNKEKRVQNERKRVETMSTKEIQGLDLQWQ